MRYRGIMRIINIRNIAGVGPLGFGLCVLFFTIFWKIDDATRIASLYGDKLLHEVLAGILLCAGGIIFFVAIRVMPISKHNKSLITHGVYSYVRHPRYAAIVFLVYPAFALFAHSFLCLLSTLMVYVIFRLLTILADSTPKCN